MPVELDSALYGPGVFDTINTMDAPAASQGNLDRIRNDCMEFRNPYWWQIWSDKWCMAANIQCWCTFVQGRATLVWTGTEMIVWGVWLILPPDWIRGKYNPVTDTWTSMSVTNAPVGRFFHTAIWSGTEMIVWGGSINLFHSKFNWPVQVVDTILWLIPGSVQARPMCHKPPVTIQRCGQVHRWLSMEA